MKAKRVKGLDPRAPLLGNAARIVSTRLAELRSFAPAALAPDAPRAQHDMRIAAKRLRYVLETVGVCLGEPANSARRAARELQDVLGDLHDCDVRFELIERHLDGPDAPVADRGLELLLARTAERRDALYERFGELWRGFDSDGTWGGLESTAAAAGAKEAAGGHH